MFSLLFKDDLVDVPYFVLYSYDDIDFLISMVLLFLHISSVDTD